MKNSLEYNKGCVIMETISANNLSKVFTRTIKREIKTIFNKTRIRKVREEFYAVNNFNFTVESGDIFGILGPNGAGKTTLLRMLGGIMTPTSGEISLLGFNLKDNPNKYKESIGYLSGNTKLYGRLTPRELLSIFGQIYAIPKKDLELRIDEILNMLEINSFADDRIEKLSTGQTQRVSIARCLIHSPKLYIFDEPTLGLDVLSSHSVINFMLSESGKGKSVIYSTHYMEEAETICNKIIMLHKGNIISAGTPDQIKKDTNTNNIRDAFIALVLDRGEKIG